VTRTMLVMLLAGCGIGLCIAFGDAYPTLQATRALEPPALDGTLDDTCWRSAASIEAFKQRGSETPSDYPSIGYVCFDERHLYIAVRCMEPDPASIVSTGRARGALTHEEDENVFGDDSVEIMVNPFGNAMRYYQFAVSVSGAAFDALRTYSGGGVEDRWQGEMSVATSIGSDSWSAELRIPFYTLELTPEVISRWRLNIARTKQEPHELSAIAREGQFNEPHKFAILTGLDVDFRPFCIRADRPLMVGDVQDGLPSAFATLSLKNETGEDRRLIVELRGDPAGGGTVKRVEDLTLAVGQTAWLDLGSASLRVQPGRLDAELEIDAAPPVRQIVVSDAGSGERLMLSNVRYPSRFRMLELDLVRPGAEEASGKERPITVEMTASIRPAARAAGNLELAVIHEETSEQVAAHNVADPARVIRVPLDRARLPLGRLLLRAAFRDGRGETIAEARRVYVNLPARTDTGRVLNNLVTELVNLDGGALGDADPVRFTNPKDGWIYFAASADGNVELSLREEDEPIRLVGHESHRPVVRQAMRWFPAGEHALILAANDNASVRNLIVRAIPALAYYNFSGTGTPIAHRELQEEVLDYVNWIGLGFAASTDPANRSNFEQWKKAGKRLVSGSKVRIWEYDRASDMVDRLVTMPAYTVPLFDGIWQEEFGIGDWPVDKYLVFAEAVNQLTGDYPAKRFYAYVHSLFGPQETKPFVQALINNGAAFCWGRYEREMSDEQNARERIEGLLTEGMNGWKNFLFEAQHHAIPVLGYYNVPPESLNENPAVDFKVWIDMQIHHLATNPTFDGLYGLMAYNANRADEETLRWQARLYHHYGIEGRTNLLSEQYGYRYALKHLQNPDFDDRLAGWTVAEADEDTISTGTFKGLGRLQGRVRGSTRGDNFLRMKRSSQGPNRVTQRIRDLEPGQWYSIKMIAMDDQDLIEGRSERQKLTYQIRIEDAEMLSHRGVRTVYESSRGQEVGGGFSRENQPWLTYDWRVFRAQAPTAELTISDWADNTEPGGSIGQELICNFIEVQPYFYK